MNNRELVLQYLEELENICFRIEREKDFKYTDILAAVRSTYWLYKEYLRLDSRYEKALKEIKALRGHSTSDELK